MGRTREVHRGLIPPFSVLSPLPGAVGGGHFLFPSPSLSFPPWDGQRGSCPTTTTKDQGRTERCGSSPFLCVALPNTLKGTAFFTGRPPGVCIPSSWSKFCFWGRQEGSLPFSSTTIRTREGGEKSGYPLSAFCRGAPPSVHLSIAI